MQIQSCRTRTEGNYGGLVILKWTEQKVSSLKIKFTTSRFTITWLYCTHYLYCVVVVVCTKTTIWGNNFASEVWLGHPLLSNFQREEERKTLSVMSGWIDESDLFSFHPTESSWYWQGDYPLFNFVSSFFLNPKVDTKWAVTILY